MHVRGLLTRVVTAAVVAAPLTVAAVAAPAHAAGETQTSFTYVSSPGEFIGQGRSGSYTDPAQFRISGTNGLVTVSVDTGTEWWYLDFAAPRGQNLAPGSYENVTRARFNTTYAGLDVSGNGRGCNEVKGRFTIYAISADGAGRVTSLDAAFTQFCENSTGSMSGTVRYAAPAAAPVVVTSSNPSTVEGQPVTFTARVAPGTGAGGVVFYDGGTAIGQGSFDANGLARLTSDQLGVGQHAITARVGTSTSAAASQTVLAGATSLWFGSEFGDYIGQGAVASYAPPGSTFSVRGTAADVSVSLDAPASGQWWTVTLAAPTGQVLRPGSYPGATRAPFRAPGEPGLSVSGSGRGCNTLTGSFTIQRIDTNPDGSVASLDGTFHQYCEGGPAGLHGRVRFNADAPTPVVATSTSVAGQVAADGKVALTATVSAPSGTPAGQVVFREGSTTLGSAPVAGGQAYLVVPGLTRGSHTVTAEYSGSTQHAPSAGSTTVVLDGIVTTTTASGLPRTAKAGKPLTVTVSVSSPSGAAVATGQVRLFDGVEPVATAATLANGRASITWNPVAKGNRSLTVRYLGDPTHAESVSAPTVVKVT